MRLEPLYRMRFTYPESWAVGLDGGWQQMFFLAEGRCSTWRTASPTAGSTTPCVCTGEVRASSDPSRPGPDLVIDVAELIWEPIAD